ncbi:MAG TPA: site-specific integrase [Candidatus Corynebacterium gallistercoris]|uniref:Site-specific integrase n=1 Tax=Candidatus Corynebacterium gallistercoris TaxID=2838530 RepID=A0A9D1UQN2_9CORY|nr:site-specific integrase [Candidatus Corynebacterium gallistercoris]
MTRGRPATPLGTLGTIHTTQLPNGTWQADARYRTTTGQTKRLRARAKSKTAAERALKEKARDKAATTTIQNLTNTSTLTALLNHWLPRHNVTETTRTTYAKAIRLHITPTIGHARLNEITTPMLQTFLEQHPPGTAKTCRAVLSAALGQAVRWGLITHNPTTNTNPPHREKKNPDALTDEQIQAYRTAIRTWCGTNTHGQQRGDGLPEIIDVLIGTGLRIGECLALRWQDVDLDAGTITITGTIDKETGTRVERTKTPTSRRTIHAAPIALQALKDQRAKGYEQYLGEAVFPSYRGGYRTVINVNRQLRLARPPELAWVTPRSFRSTVSTRIEQEYGLLAASRHLGHASTAVTESAYLSRPAVQPDYTSALTVPPGD